MTGAALERVVVGVLVGLAAFAVASLVAFGQHAAVAAWWLPAACAFGVMVSKPPSAWPPAMPARRGLVPIVIGVLVATLVAVGYGALATPSRQWDGAVAWDTTARFLAGGLSLEQPYFRDPAVLAYSRDYPLLQPLLLASFAQVGGPAVGRAVFPLLHALLGLLAFVSVRRSSRDGNLPWLAAAAVMLVPTLTSPGGGSIDSGYGDALLLLATTTIAAGCWRPQALLLAAGTALAVASKPEGLVYAGAATAVAFVFGDRRQALAAAVGWLGAAAAWLPVQRGLVAPGTAPERFAFATAAALGVVGVAVAAAVVQRLGWQWRGRLALLVVAGVAVALAFTLVAPGLPKSGAMHAYFEAPERLLQRLDRLPAFVLGVCNHALLRGGCGLAFWCFLLALPLARRRAAECVAPVAWVLLGLGIVPLPFLFGPESDLQHYLRSSIDRLLLHWTGPALLTAFVALARGSAEAEAHGESARDLQRGDAQGTAAT